MLKNKSAILLLAIAILCLLSVSVFATEESGAKVYGEGDKIVWEEDITANGCDGVFKVGKGAELTINDGNIYAEICGHKHKVNKEGEPEKFGEYAMAVWADGGKVIINGGTFTNGKDPYTPAQTDLIYVKNGGEIIINGGTFKSSTPGWTLNVNNEKNSGKIIVRGGKFYQFNPLTANTTEGFYDGKGIDPNGNNEVVVDEGYTVIKNGDYYEVVKLNDPVIIDGGEPVTLNKDIKANGCDGAIWAKNGANVTIDGGNIYGQLCADTNHNNGGRFAMAVWADNATVTINGGTFGNDYDPKFPEQSDLIYVKNGGKVIINGGEFKGSTPRWTLNSHNKNVGTIIVQGGRFYQFDPSNPNVDDNQITVPEGYSVIKDGEWYWVCGHKDCLTKTDAKAATYTTDGNIEYYTCSKCNKLFEDEKAITETKASDVIIPMLIQISGGNASVGDVVVDEAITEAGNSSAVELPVVENATAVTVKAESLKAVEHADKGLTVTTKDTTVTLDAKAVEEVVKQAGNAAEIKIEVVKAEEKTLNKEQKEAIKDKEVAIVLSASILADGKEISNFNGGKVKVEIPFTPAEGTNGSDYKVYYVADDGKVTAVPTRYVKGKLVVELEHFSEYVVVKEVANAGGSAPAVSAPAANPNEKDNTPKTGAISVIGLVIAMSVVGLAVLKRD